MAKTMNRPFLLPSLLTFACFFLASFTSYGLGGTTPKPVRREVYRNGRIFDITHRYIPELPLYGSKQGIGHFRWLQLSMKNGSLTNNSEFKLPVHTGTHVDAPGHVIDEYYDGFDVDQLDLAVLNGPALVVDVPRNSNITDADTSNGGECC